MSCNKIRYTCGEITYAKCTRFQGIVSEDSELFEETCLDVEQVIEDVYSMMDDIKEDINLNNLENTCIIFTEPKTVASVIEQMYTKLCELESLIEVQNTTIETLQNQVQDLQAQNCP